MLVVENYFKIRRKEKRNVHSKLYILIIESQNTLTIMINSKDKKQRSMAELIKTTSTIGRRNEPVSTQKPVKRLQGINSNMSLFL